MSTPLSVSDVLSVEGRHTSGVYPKRPIALVSGAGSRVTDESGRTYLDAASGHGVAVLGHSHPALVAAVENQVRRLVTCPETYPNDRRAELLSRLAALTPGDPGQLDRFFFCNSGTEAVEAALKFARLSTGRTGVVALKRGFHGRTMGALSATADKRHRQAFEPLVPGFEHVAFDDLAAMDAAIGDETAAVIIEIVQGEGGVHVGSAEWLAGLRALCTERGALLIVDEIQTGFGRTGAMFAADHFDLVPDLLCLGKAIAGGIPMGAVAIGSAVGELPNGAHGSTFGGNPLACAAALAVLDVLRDEQLAERAADLGARARTRLSELDAPMVREVRGLGLMIGVECKTRVTPMLMSLLERGVLVLPAGPTVLRLLPPLTIPETDFDQVLDEVCDVLKTAKPPARRPRPMNAVDLLTEIVATESFSGDEGAVAVLLAGRMNEMGFDAHVDAAGNAVGTRRGPEVPGQPERHIVLLGHMDTVPGTIPVRREGDLLYGRGSVDAKGPLATFVMAVAGIDPAPGCVLTVIGAVEEESATSKGARHIAAEHEAPELCLIGEPSGWDALTLGYKGRVLLDYKLVLPCGHSAGPLAGAPEHAAAFWQSVQRLCDEANDGLEKLFDQVLPSLRSMRTDSDGLHDTARLTIGLRLPPEFDRNAWAARLTEAAGNADLDLYGYEPAWRSERSSPLARAFLRAIRSQQGTPRFKVKTGTADLNVLGPVWGCPIAAYGPGDSTLDHTPNEHISLAEYERAISVLSTALVEAGFAN